MNTSHNFVWLGLIPLFVVYLVVACYHSLSVYANPIVVRTLTDVRPRKLDTPAHWLFISVIIANCMAWSGALVLFVIYGFWAAQSIWQGWGPLWLCSIFVWCWLQPALTSWLLPQALSLLHVRTASREVRMCLSLFYYSRLPGFALGLAMSFLAALLIVSVRSVQTHNELEFVRDTMGWSFLAFATIIVLASLRLAFAQRAVFGRLTNVETEPNLCEASDLDRFLRAELVLYSTYYALMGLCSTVLGIVAFNFAVSAREGYILDAAGTAVQRSALPFFDVWESASLVLLNGASAFVPLATAVWRLAFRRAATTS